MVAYRTEMIGRNLKIWYTFGKIVVVLENLT